ncbi:DNA-binding protein, partial [Nonomuraea sp. NPDC059022]
MTSTLTQHTVLPPEATAAGTREQLKGFLAALRTHQAKLTGPDGTELTLPDEVYAVLRDVVEALAQGQAISIAPLDAVLTTQQAA